MRNEFHNRLRCRVVTFLDDFGNRPGLLLLLFAAVYFTGFGLIASKGVISNDELFTLYISRLPRFRDVWAALATGAEQTPPLFYAISRADIHLFGTSGLALRLPELLAFALMCLCLFHIVARRTSAVYGFLAMLFALMTNAFNFALEARAYALVLAFSAFALLCWLWAVEARHRVLALVGLAVSLAAAISCHYYSVLSLFPIGMGELARSFRRKQIDVGVWLSLVLSLSPLLAFLHLMESARKYAPHFWAKPHWSSMAYFYQHFLLTPTAVPLLTIFLAAVLCSFLRRCAEGKEATRERPRIPLHEMSAVVGFLLIPAVGVALAKTVVGAYSDRYALPAVIGVCIIVAWGLSSLVAAREAPAAGLALLLCAFLIVKEVQTYRLMSETRALRTATFAFLEANGRGDSPIVVSGSTEFTELTYQAPSAIAGRLLYLADPGLALQYTGTNSAEKGLLEMKHWAGLNVQSFRSFAASGHPCYIYVEDFPDEYKWIIPELRAANWKLTLVAWQPDGILFVATPVGKGSTSGE